MDNLFDLTGRVAVVTGASSGLGADAARAYAGQGADVALLARRVEKLKTVADEIAATGRKVLVVGCDVTDEEQVRKAIGQVVARFGKIDILLNNAGVAVPGTVEQLTTDEWDKEMNTNVRGAAIRFQQRFRLVHPEREDHLDLFFHRPDYLRKCHTEHGRR